MATELISVIMNSDPGRALRRRTEILRLVRGRPVRSQEELQALLRRRGFAVAQPTLSRDVRHLGLARTPTGYTAPTDPALFVPVDHRAETLDQRLRLSVLSVQTAGTLVIVRTPPAGADPIARAIDEAGLRDVAGTIAGDDTVFVATSSTVAARRLERRLRRPLASRARRA
jgi:transcriptional regulator of arginine metabolism